MWYHPGMWEEIEDKKRRLDALRPLTAKSLRALEAWYDVELTYTSNAIEGNALTRAETAIVFEKGLTIGGKPLKDHLEAIDHKEALDYVRQLAGRDEPIREVDIRQIHRLVLARSQPEEAGRYAQHQRMIAGSPLDLPSPAEIPARMGDFARWLGAAGAGTGDGLRGPRPAGDDPPVRGRQRPHGAPAHEPDPAESRLPARRHRAGAPRGVHRQLAGAPVRETSRALPMVHGCTRER